jgi:Tol biopolymer transport system component
MLTAGTRLGPYEIVAPLGAGGMGEVYKAKDTRLDRTVAVKIMPAALAADPEFRQRFDREAKAISQLSHPHICTLYDVGEHEGIAFLVMEHLEGETLAQRLTKGPLPVEQALRDAIEIADALVTAHRHGVVHRDLKPGNVMLTKAGTKLLDFGLARTGVAPASVSLETRLSSNPGAVPPDAPLTSRGTILGTFQYMAPEQIEGAEADARTDIWAFGCVLYEMLSGRRAFEGKSQVSLLGAILEREPTPIAELQPSTPPALARLVRTCFAKSPDDRFQTAHDLWLQLQWVEEGGSAAGIPAPVAARRRSRERFAWATALVLAAMTMAAGALAIVHLRETPSPVEPVQFTIAAEENSNLGALAQFAISSDGRQLAFVAASPQATPMVWLRPLTSLAARALPGTEGAFMPFWSPDGRYIGFFAAGKLKKVQTSGGSPMVLCDASGGGATWNRDNVIVFSPSPVGPLHKVDAAGGTSSPVTALGKAETSHRWPSFLPDGRHFLYFARGSVRELRVASLDSPDTVSLGPAESDAGYASGHLLFSRGLTLMAQPFDPAALRRTADPFPVAEQVPVWANGRAGFSVSATGVLAYHRGAAPPVSRLTWMDRTGKTLALVGDPGPYFNLSVSPDERRVAVSMAPGTPPNRDIWLIDLGRGDTASRLTSHPGADADPIWSPDGRTILFNSNRNDGYNTAYLRASDGGGQDEPMVTMQRLVDSPDWSHNGRFVVFTGDGDQVSNDLWTIPTSGERKPVRWLKTTSNEDSPAFSPDDRWIAFNSNATGRFEVYVRSFTGGDGQFQISRGGGWAPKWRGDGKELFFLALDGTMMSADITAAKEIEAGVPRALFKTTLLRGSDRHTYAVTRDGTRFLLPVRDPRQLSVPMTIVVNWPALVKQ